jgi:hypothetical protein
MRLALLSVLAFAMCAPLALAQTAQSPKSVESEIVRLEEQVSAANVRGDVATLRRLLSDS